jgi:DNA polymerase
MARRRRWSAAMADIRSATSRSNAGRAWATLREEARTCTRCHLYRHATQTVFGEGDVRARLMLVGEQPGDREDVAGLPFVGPAGAILDKALGDAGIDRAATYVTNAVKHFKFEQRGKRRIHSKPNAGEISACRWWLELESAILRPLVTVAMGATAARAVVGKPVTISRVRGQPIPLDETEAWVTVHPSFLLRIRDRMDKEAEYARFVEDLIRVRDRVQVLAG